MAELRGEAGELRFTIEIKRKATGKVETYNLIGKINDGSNPFDRSPQRRD
jgi:hypothetical protein